MIDAVVRTAYFKYFHPKEALINNGILNRGLLQEANKIRKAALGDDVSILNTINYVYPFGATLNVAKPAIAVLSTGSVSFPLNRPICAFYTDKGSGGKIVVLGSTQIFTDAYMEKEDNSMLKDILFQFLTDVNFQLNTIDSDDPEISDYYTVPDIELLAEQPFSSLQVRNVLKIFRNLISKLLTKSF